MSTSTPPAIAFVGAGEVARRPLFRALSTFIDTNFEDVGRAGMDVLFIGDDTWTGTTDAAFDFVMEDERFGPPVVLHPSDEATDEGSLLADLQKDGAELVETGDGAYAALLADALDPEETLDVVIAFFDEEDEALTEFVTAMLEAGVPVYDACSQMLAFSLAEEADGEVLDDDVVTAEDAPEPEAETATEAAPEPVEVPSAETLVAAALDAEVAVQSVLDEAAALSEDEAIAMLTEVERDLLVDVAESLNVTVKKGQWAKSIAANVYAAMVAPAGRDEDEVVEEQVSEEPEHHEAPADDQPEVDAAVSVDEDDSESAEDEPHAQDDDESVEEPVAEEPVAGGGSVLWNPDDPSEGIAVYDWDRAAPTPGSVTITTPAKSGRVVTVNLDLARLFELCDCDAEVTAKAAKGMLSAL